MGELSRCLYDRVEVAAGLCHATAGRADPRIPDPIQQAGGFLGQLLEGSWVNYWRIIDPPRSERTNPDLFHTMSIRTNYQTNCAPCHTSQLHAPNARAADTRVLVFREPGVNCEMCHGPSARHVAAMSAGARYSKL